MNRQGKQVYTTVLVSSVLVALSATLLRAQPSDSTSQSCDGRRITAIDVQSYPPAVIGRSPSALKRVIQRTLFQSTTTREQVVRPFILTSVGRRCSDALRRELARVLRAQPYIAGATVHAVPDSADGVRLAVETVDEIPLIVSGGWNDGLSTLTIGNENIAGLGVRAVGRWRDGGWYRDGLSLRLRKHAVFGEPLVFALEALREPLGSRTAYSLTAPFFSDLQKLAWHIGGEHTTLFNRFVPASGPHESLPVKRDVLAAGAVLRIGWRERAILAGPIATYERARPNDQAVVVSDSGLVAPSTPTLDNRYAPYETFRFGVSVGLRLLDYVAVNGLDALLAEQDIARGVQVSAQLARSIAMFGGDDRGNFAALDLYSGAGSARSFAGLRLHGEGMKLAGSSAWSAVVISGRAAWYAKATERRTFEASAEFSGGWRERLPLQLSLGDVRGGVRGYQGATVAGGRRAVLRLEQRSVVGGVGPALRWGAAFFSDIGKTWSGDVPFGETTVARASVGVGLLAAIPARSRRTLRADVAVPITGDAPKRWVLRVAMHDATRFFWREPNDIARTRAGAPTTSIFGWP